MSATDLERPVRLMRASRRVNMFIVVLNVLILALDLTAGSGLVFVPATVIVLLLALIVAQTRLIRTARARERDLNRPRMTAEDYRQLREMELELGWEPSELPEGMTAPVRPARKAQAQAPDEYRARAAGPAEPPRPFPGIPSGSGTLSAKTTWDDVAYPSEASRHFAQLARVGLEHCLSYCPLCLYRLFGPLPDGVKSDASMWQWLEENWGWKQ